MELNNVVETARALSIDHEMVRRHIQHLDLRYTLLTKAEQDLIRTMRKKYPVTYEEHARTIG